MSASMKAGYEVDGLRVAQARHAILSSRGKPLTQAELAASVGVHHLTVNRIENGHARVSLETLERLTTVLNVTRDHLLGTESSVEAATRIQQEKLIREALAPLEAALFEVVTQIRARSEAEAREVVPT